MSLGERRHPATEVSTGDLQMPLRSLQASVLPSGDHVGLANGPGATCAIAHAGTGRFAKPDVR